MTSRPECLIVTPTYRAVAKYCNRVLPLLEAFWTDHPPVIFLSDNDNLDSKHIFVKRANSWLEILFHGLLSIKASNPDITHIFLLLDDHYPLRACDEELIAINFDVALRNDLACVSFVTYVWPWTTTECVDYPDGMIRTWRRIDTRRFHDCEMATVPNNFFRYFQLQPSLWQFDYLIDICREAYEAQCSDPWSFESFTYSKPRPITSTNMRGRRYIMAF